MVLMNWQAGIPNKSRMLLANSSGVICYTCIMKTQYDPHRNINPFNIEAERPDFASSFKEKKWLWIGIGGAILIVVLVISLVILINTPDKTEIIGGGDIVELTYEENDDFSTILNIFANISDGMTEDDLKEILRLAEADQSYLHINSDEGVGYIAQEDINLSSNDVKQNAEYISFDYVLADENYDSDHISNIVYHSYHDGGHDYITLAPDYEYVHAYGDYANSFDNIMDAINDYLMHKDN